MDEVEDIFIPVTELESAFLYFGTMETSDGKEVINYEQLNVSILTQFKPSTNIDDWCSKKK